MSGGLILTRAFAFASFYEGHETESKLFTQITGLHYYMLFEL